MENEYWWVWLGIGVNLAYILLMNFMIIICLAYLPGRSAGSALLRKTPSGHRLDCHLLSLLTRQISSVCAVGQSPANQLFDLTYQADQLGLRCGPESCQSAFSSSVAWSACQVSQLDLCCGPGSC